MYNRILTVTLFLSLLGFSELNAQKKTVTIPFSSKDKIVYDLDKGVYNVFLDNKEVIHEAHFEISTATKKLDSRSAGPAEYSSSTVRAKTGSYKLHRIKFGGDVPVEQLFYIYPKAGLFYMQLSIPASAGSASYMAPLVADNFSLGQSSEGDMRALYVPFDNDMWARYNASPLATADFTSSEVTAIYNSSTNKGIVTGSLEQDNWKSGIRIKGKDQSSLSSLSLFAGLSDSIVTHDRVPHGSVLPRNGKISSPLMLFSSTGDWRLKMEEFADMNSRLQPRKIFNWAGPTPMGWNSWGVLQDKINFEKTMKVVSFFADSLKGFRMNDRTLFIDLDAFWDNMTTNGIDGDISKLVEFVSQCKKNGLRPGIYWTPFADWGKSDRKVEGAPDYSYPETWTKQHGRMLDIDGGRAMDPTHPATKLRIVNTISKMKKIGFEMIKIDFLGHGAQEADKFFDPAVTTGMQAFAQGMSFLDSVLGKQMLVYAAISPNLATARYVHARRIACDAFSSLDHTEYTLNSTGYGWWQSHIYNYMDADHVVFAKEEDGVNRARLAAALVTGTLFTGDDYGSEGKWRNTAKQLLQNEALLSVIKDGKSFRPVYGNTGNRGVELFIKEAGDSTYIAHFNYSKEAKTLKLPANLLAKIKGRGAITELFSQHRYKPEPFLEVRTPASDVTLYRIFTGR